MKCIFCKTDSAGSKSVEHIIPESLGNKNQTLTKGIVCDSCNNYFARKIEKIVLELPYFKSLRGRNIIESKKGRMPGIPGFINKYGNTELEILFRKKNIIEVIVENKDLFNKIESGCHKELYIPYLPEPPKENIHLSKFIGKIAIEALAM